MVVLIARTGSQRKLRLFAVACCRRIQHVFPDQAKIESRLSAAERYADGLATTEALRREHRRMALFGEDATHPDASYAACLAQLSCEMAALRGFANLVTPKLGLLGRLRQFIRRRPAPEPSRDVPTEYKTERLAHCDLLRDIFGNPFRPITCDPEWRTSTVLALAQGIYDERAFDRMPILADALQDAGCDNADILDHCRGSGPHVRGCWVVDLVLGKT
jgi:hypothetical protein